MRYLIRFLGCLVSIFGGLVPNGAAYAEIVKTSDGEVFEHTPVRTVTFTVGWNASGAKGEFYKLAQRIKSYPTQQPALSGDNYSVPGGSFAALNSRCYLAPSTMTWVDNYDCDFSFNGTTLTCLYDGTYLYSPSTGVWAQLGCKYVSSYEEYINSNGVGSSSGSGTGSGTGSGVAADCYYTYASSGSAAGPSSFVAPAFEWHFLECDAGFHFVSGIDVGSGFVTVPIAGATAFESSCVDDVSYTDRSLSNHYYTFLGMSNSEVDSGNPISLYSGCAECPAMDDISNISDAEYLSSVSVPSANTNCYRNVTARDQKGTFSIENCWYSE